MFNRNILLLEIRYKAVQVQVQVPDQDMPQAARHKVPIKGSCNTSRVRAGVDRGEKYKGAPSCLFSIRVLVEEFWYVGLRSWPDYFEKHERWSTVRLLLHFAKTAAWDDMISAYFVNWVNHIFSASQHVCCRDISAEGNSW